MDREQFFKVIEIISEHHSTEVVINEAVNGVVDGITLQDLLDWQDQGTGQYVI